MYETLKLLSPFVAGLFALTSAYLAWKLKNHSDINKEKLLNKKERKEEIKQLYIEIIELLEKTIYEATRVEGEIPVDRFQNIHARVHLLSPTCVNNSYDEACSKLQDYIELHKKATPEVRKVGDRYITTLRAPDPTVKFKEPAQKAYEAYRSSFTELINTLKNELKQNI